MMGGSQMMLLAFFTPGPYELIIIGVVAVLLFGRRLPEVGRSLGRGIVEFKRGIRGLEDDIDDAATKPDPPKIDNPSNLPNAGLSDTAEGASPDDVPADEPAPPSGDRQT